ncbi:MAG: hypothetical protein E7055_10215 [Lentisphaerae bacterium]|nr:hypothetical protein [Lentisphaerota bacterium]
MNSLVYLFKSIPKMLFEPLAICTLIWIILALFIFRKRDKLLFWMVFASIVFMLSWRLCFRMKSSRYAAFLIYPSVIFTACFCLKTRTILHWVFQRLKWGKPLKYFLCKIFPALTVFGLAAACIGKTLHRNPYGNFLYDVTQTYLKHSGGKGCIHTQRSMRVAWYIGRSLKKEEELNSTQDEAALPFVRKAVAKAQNIPGNHYFFYYLNKGDPEPNSQTMKSELAGGEWKILDRRYVSSRKNREFILALYKPVCPNIEEWSGKIPDQPQGNLYPGGDFETVLQGEKLKDYLDLFKRNGITEYMSPTDRKLPSGWWPGLGEKNKDNPPDIRLHEKSPLAGKYSLFIDSRPPRKTASIGVWGYINDRNCKYSLFVRGNGNEESKLKVILFSQNKVLRKFLTREVLEFLLQPGKLYRIHGSISIDKYPAEWRNFSMEISVDGCVTLDQVSAVPF